MVTTVVEVVVDSASVVEVVVLLDGSAVVDVEEGAVATVVDVDELDDADNDEDVEEEEAEVGVVSLEVGAEVVVAPETAAEAVDGVADDDPSTTVVATKAPLSNIESETAGSPPCSAAAGPAGSAESVAEIATPSPPSSVKRRCIPTYIDMAALSSPITPTTMRSFRLVICRLPPNTLPPAGAPSKELDDARGQEYF